MPQINIKNNYKPLTYINHTSMSLINIKNNYKSLIHTKHTSITLITLITMISH